MSENKDVTNSLVKSYQTDLDKTDKFKIVYEPDKPELVNFDNAKAVVEAISTRYKNTVIQNSDEANIINKRGGLLTKLRKLRNSISDKKTEVHRKAKESYIEMDGQLNELVQQIDESIVNLKDQVDNFKIKEYEKRMSEIEKIYSDEVNSDQFSGKIPDFYDFQEFLRFNQKIDKAGDDDKVRKIIVSDLKKVYDDVSQIDKYYEKDYKSDAFYDTAIEKYKSTRDLNASLIDGIDEYQRQIEIAKKINEEGLLKDGESHDQGAAETNTPDKNDSQVQAEKDISGECHDKSVDQDKIIKNEKVYYVFVTDDLQDARKLKSIAEKEGIRFAFKKVVK